MSSSLIGGTITEYTTLNTRKGEPEYAFYLLIKLYNTSLRSNVTYREPLYISSTTMI